MMVQLSVWAAWLLIALTIIGAGTVVYLALGIIGGALNRGWDWLADQKDAADSGVPVTGFKRLRAWERDRQESPADELEPLPPEQTWEQMITHPPTPALLGSRQAMAHYRKLEAERKRAFRPVERKIRAAYASLGLEGTGFTRAMAAQVRELTP